MVTGDNLKTAKAIALECGILDDSEASAQAIIEGRVFRAYDDTERENVAGKISVSLTHLCLKVPPFQIIGRCGFSSRHSVYLGA